MPVVIILFLVLDFRVGFGDEGKMKQEFSGLSTSLSFEKLLLQIFIYFFLLSLYQIIDLVFRALSYKNVTWKKNY